MGKCYTIGETSDAFEEPYGILELETGNVAYSEDGTTLVFDTWSEARDYAGAYDIEIYRTPEYEIGLLNESVRAFQVAMYKQLEVIADILRNVPNLVDFMQLRINIMPNNQRKRFGLPMFRKQGLKRAWKNRRKE